MGMMNFDSWVPYRLDQIEGKWRAQWCRLGSRRFTNAFFAQTLDACVSRPANLLLTRETPVEFLGGLAAQHPGLPPVAFVFHMSRCGSTLVTQSLASLERNIVISEAAPLDDVLRATTRDPSITDDIRVQWFQWMISALGRRRFPAETGLFVKFDCWHTLALPLIRRAFPAVPWIFVYRNPVEVLASHQRQPGPQMIPGVIDPGWFAWDEATVAAMPPGEYGARALAAVCQAALEAHPHGNCEFINYNELPDVILRRLLPRWNPGLTALELEQATIASKRNAKNPALPFVSDTVAKHTSATEDCQRLARIWLEPVYERLENAREASSRLVSPA